MPFLKLTFLRLLAQRIKFFRREKGRSQEKPAERAAMQRYLADLERGTRNPSVRTLVMVASALGLSVSSLVEEPPKVLRERR